MIGTAAAGAIGEAERQALLGVARRAISCLLEGAAFEPDPGPPVDVQGAFVTLRRRSDHELRGCIGTVQPHRGGLADLVARTARAAATRDPRFPPVDGAELPGLSIEISILGPLGPATPETVEVGRHGLVIRHRGHQGLLLPQVPAEQGWDREAFLDGLCRKAGLPRGAWREPGCELECFTAEVFGED